MSFFAVLLPVALVGGFLRGFTGFGGPLFVMPILTLFLPPASAAATMMAMDLSANLQMLPAARRHWSLQVLGPMTAGMLIGMPLGAEALLAADPVLMKRVIGGVVLAAAVALLLGWRYRKPVGGAGYGLLGFVSGAIMGATSIGVLTPLFLNAGTASAAENRANIVAWVAAATLLLLVLLSARSALGAGDLPVLLPLIGAYLVGIALGVRSYGLASEAAVRRAMLLCIVGIAGMTLVL